MRTNDDKVKRIRCLFSGRKDAYSTFDLKSGESYVVKKPVADKVILDHLLGRKPYRAFLLVKNKTQAIAVDFDTQDRLSPWEFVVQAKHYDLSSYIERSKSKGYHVWIFFEEVGVSAAKARLVVHHILHDMEQPNNEVFPKHDSLDSQVHYGNFIDIPLFGRAVSKGNTVFVDPITFEPYPNQWEFLESVHRHKESHLDNIIELNNFVPTIAVLPAAAQPVIKKHNRSCLPICAKKMLGSGVIHYQRGSCFRLAVLFKRLGLPHDAAIAALKVWAQKNRPQVGKQIISESEITEQTLYAYAKDYRGYGCNSEAVAPFCETDCPVTQIRSINRH